MEMESLAGIVMGSPWSLAAAVFVQQSSSYFLGLVLGRWRCLDVPLASGELLHRVSLVLEEWEAGEGLGSALHQVLPPAQVPPPTRAPVSPLYR